MTSSPAVCREERRREDVRKANLLGLDYVEVDPAAVPPQTVLEVFFLGKKPDNIQPANVTITGGSPVRVKSVHYPAAKGDPKLDEWMTVTVDAPGDFSTYTLALVKLDDQGRPTTAPMDGLDARYATATFSFKASCPSDLDCYAPQVCPPPPRVQPDINYLAKDYTSFRQLIFDRLAQTMPNWRETHVADIGVMLVELLAYAGDQLSYYQDAVATEAYLGTSRQRISVRRHARLVDYALHEGCNARAWLTIATKTDTKLDPANVFFCTPFADAPAGHVLQPTTSRKLRRVAARSSNRWSPTRRSLSCCARRTARSTFIPGATARAVCRRARRARRSPTHGSRRPVASTRGRSRSRRMTC